MANLKKQAEDLGITVDKRWSDETLQRKIDEAKVGDPANHDPATSKETSNAAGEEVQADNVANRKNEDGRTNDVDFEKNTGPGPGNPDQRVIDPKTLTEGKPVETPEAFIAGPAIDADGNKMKTEETPKVVHQTVSASGPREITNNVIPDQNERSPLVIAAGSMGIMIDPSWDDQRILAEMQQAMEGRADLQVKGAVPKLTMSEGEVVRAAKVPVLLKADYWEDDGEGGANRVSAGTEHEFDTATARKLIDEGKAERKDKLPGE